jgi:uncharacterized protein YoxC
MDYEFRIKLLETELTHAREMQQLCHQRQDTFDGRLDLTKMLIDKLTTNVDNLTTNVDHLAMTVGVLSEKVDGITDKLDKLTTNVNNLVGALLRQNPN